MISAETILKPNMEYIIDKALHQFEQPFAKKYNLIKSKNPNTCNNLIMFGCYNISMYTLLKDIILDASGCLIDASGNL